MKKRLKKWMIAALACATLMTGGILSVHGAESTLGSYPTVVGKTSAYANREESPLYGRNVLFFGDSLCRARGDDYSGYAGRLGAKYNMNWKNCGASGYALSRAKGSSTILTTVQNAYGDNIMREEPIDYELVVLAGGVNDAWVDAPIGEVSESFSYRDFDRNTMAGGMEATICRAKEYFPNATLCYLLMYQMPKAQWKEDGVNWEPVTGVQNMDEYVAVQRQILEKWQIPYLDFYGDESFNRDVFYVDTTTYLSVDYVHMQPKGYNLLFQYIGTWLETLPLPERQISETETETELPTESVTESETVVQTEAETDPLPTEEARQKRIPLWGMAVVAVAAVALVGGGCLLILIKKRR